MPKPQRHGTGFHPPREYSGQEEARPLLEWLNQPIKDRARQNVGEILEIFCYLQERASPKRNSANAYSKEDLNNSNNRLSDLLREYKYYPMLLPLGSRSGCYWYPVPRGSKYARGWAAEYDDANAVYHLAQLAKADLLNQLKKCSCGRWLFARFSHQRFCSAQCREKEFRSSPEWKEYRRKKAREYYQLHKSGKVK